MFDVRNLYRGGEFYFVCTSTMEQNDGSQFLQRAWPEKDVSRTGVSKTGVFSGASSIWELKASAKNCFGEN